MTPEELNRTINFIVESQARLSAAQEQDRVDRIEFEKWSRSLLTQMAVDRQELNQLLQSQSRRIDSADARLERAEREDREAQRRHDELLREMRASFDRVLDKLSERSN